MNLGSIVFLTFWLVILLLSFWLKLTTIYILNFNKLTIVRGGLIWMEILFDDIEDITVQRLLDTRVLQLRLYKISSTLMKLRIRKRRGFRCVIINPDNPQAMINAVNKYRLEHPLEPAWSRYPGPELAFPEDWSDRQSEG